MSSPIYICQNETFSSVSSSASSAISGLTGNFTWQLTVSNLTQGKGATFAVETSADGYVDDIQQVWVVETVGGQLGGFYAAPDSYAVTQTDVPDSRIGVANVAIRLSVTQIDAGASVIASLQIIQ